MVKSTTLCPSSTTWKSSSIKFFSCCSRSLSSPFLLVLLDFSIMLNMVSVNIATSSLVFLPHCSIALDISCSMTVTIPLSLSFYMPFLLSGRGREQVTPIVFLRFPLLRFLLGRILKISSVGCQHRQAAGGTQPAAGCQPQPAAWNNQDFQGMTAQQNLLGTLEQQLQQAVTRVILQALAGAVPGLGQGMGSAPPSSHLILTDLLQHLVVARQASCMTRQ
jgi:hypothetical protein